MEIKEIKGYLGTGCKLIYACILDAENDEVNILDSRTLQHAVDTSYGTYEVRLALRPLSDLTKEIEHNGEKFVPIEWLEDKYYTLDLHKECKSIFEDSRWLTTCSWLLIQHLQNWHFDVFGLIEKGEAININTLK